MFVDDMKHSKIELYVLLSLCINLYMIYFRRISSKDGIALALHRGCRLNKRLKELLYVIRNLLCCVFV